MIARTAVFFSIKKADAKAAPAFFCVDYLVRVEVPVGIGYAFFSKSVNISFAVHPVSVLIHGTDDVVALGIVEVRLASYLNGAVSVCGRIVVILISVGIFDTVLIEGVRGSAGILPASVRHLGDIHTVSAAVIEITGSFGGSSGSGVGRIASGGITGAAVVRISGGAAVIASAGTIVRSGSGTCVAAGGSTAIGSGGAACGGTGCTGSSAGRSTGGSAVRTGAGVGRSLVIIGRSTGLRLGGLLSCFFCCLFGSFFCLRLRLRGNKGGCLRLAYLDFFSLFAAAA